MLGFCRLWLKLAAAIALVVGCNVAAPAMSAATDAMVMTSDMPCHQPDHKRGALPTPCGKACLAIPATAVAVAPSPATPVARYAPALPVFTGLMAPPATPPPRAAQHA